MLREDENNQQQWNINEIELYLSVMLPVVPIIDNYVDPVQYRFLIGSATNEITVEDGLAKIDGYLLSDYMKKSACELCR